MKVVKEASPEWTFARGERNGKMGENIPGPGNYDNDIAKLKANYSFSMGGKGSMNSPIKSQRDFNPGPGSYEINNLNKSPSYTLSGKPKENQKDANPGPGSYDYAKSLMTQYNKNVGFGGTSKRNHSKSQQDTLGPGAYSPKQEVVKYKVPVFAFGSSKKSITSRDLSPGPGAYSTHNQEFGQNAQKITLSGRPKISRKDDGPGPGEYNYDHKSIGDSISKSQRGTSALRNKEERLQSPNKDQLSSPGPGAYEPNKKLIKSNNPKYGFGKSKRQEMVNKDYKLAPGPGAYDPKHKKNMKSFKMGQKLHNTLKNDVPGPGNYEPNHNFGKSSTRAAKISKTNNKSHLVHSKSTNQLGPGDYYVNRDLGKNGPKFSMPGKPKQEKPKDVPGPGQYDPSDNLSKERIPSTIIKNTEKRFESHKSSQSFVVGPGTYHREEDFAREAHSFQIRGRPKESNQQLSPGPGAYDPRDEIIKSNNPCYKQGQSARSEMIQKQTKDQPGPGSYTHQHKTIGKDVPKFTMGTRTSVIEHERSPGPGAYDPTDSLIREAIRNAKITMSKRDNGPPKSAREIPGPGAYDSPQKTIGQDSIKVTIYGRREDFKYDNNPGPGAYDARDDLKRSKSPSFNIGSRTERINRENNPGPGTYDQTQQIGKAGPKYSFSTRNERKTKNDVPGPGIYDPNDFVIKDKVIAYKMSASSRLPQGPKEHSPGPGTYESPKKIAGPKFSLGAKRSQSRQEQSPGPGHYEPLDDRVRDKSPSVIITSGPQRNNFMTNEDKQKPGPGHYYKEEEFGKNSRKVAILGRQEQKIDNDIPGPGKYSPETKLTKEKIITHKMSLSQRMDIVTKEMRSTPGPGEFDPPILKTAPSATIRGKPSPPPRDPSPGPGHYSPDSHHTKPTLVTFTLPSSARPDLVPKSARDLPGPGIYDHSSSSLSGKAFSFKSRPKDSNTDHIPGPGAYEIMTHQRVQQVVIGSTSRQDIVSKENKSKPGPGQYSAIEKEFAKDAKSFQIRGRPQDKIGNEVPGPGQYSPEESLSKERVRTYKMNQTQRSTQIAREDSPGPGTYESPSKLGKGAQYSIKGRQETPPRDYNPGPGAYDPQASAVKHNSPGVKITQPQFFSPEKPKLPGPGHYDQQSQIGKGKSFSMRGKPQEAKQDKIPGPGSYNASHEIIKDKIHSVKISFNKRETLTVAQDVLQNRGPGSYDVKSLKSSQAFTIRGREQHQTRDYIPGPGTYEFNESVTQTKSQGAKFSRSPDRSRSRSPHKDKEPGPGQYDARDYNLAGHMSIAYTIPKGEKIDNNDDTPGPGHYKIPVKFADVPRYSMPYQSEEFRYV